MRHFEYVSTSGFRTQQAHHYPGPRFDEKTGKAESGYSKVDGVTRRHGQRCQISQIISIVSSDLASSWHKNPRLRRRKRVTQRMSKSVKSLKRSMQVSWRLFFIFAYMPYSAIPPRFLFRLRLLQLGLHHRRLPGRGTCHGKDLATKDAGKATTALWRSATNYTEDLSETGHDNPLHLLHSALAVGWVEESPAAKAQPVTVKLFSMHGSGCNPVLTRWRRRRRFVPGRGGRCYLSWVQNTQNEEENTQAIDSTETETLTFLGFLGKVILYNLYIYIFVYVYFHMHIQCVYICIHM